MEVSTAIRKICEKCYIIRRNEKLIVIYINKNITSSAPRIIIL